MYVFFGFSLEAPPPMKNLKRFFVHNSGPRASQNVKLCFLGDLYMLDRTVRVPRPQDPKNIVNFLQKSLRKP